MIINRLSIKQFILYAVIIGIMGLSGVLGVYAFITQRTNAETERIIKTGQQLTSALHGLYEDGLQTEQALRNIILNPQDDTAKANYSNADEDFIKIHAESMRLVSGKIQDRLGTVKTQWEELQKTTADIQSLATAGKTEEAKAMLVNTETPKWRAVKDELRGIIKEQKESLETELDRQHGFMSKVNTTIFALVMVSILGAFILYFILAENMITKPLEQLTDKIVEVSDGNLTVNLTDNVSGKDVGKLMAAMSLLTSKFDGIMSAIRHSVTALDTGDKEIQSSVRHIGEGVLEQQMLTDDTSTTITNMLSTIKNVSALMEGVKTSAASALETATAGESIGTQSNAKIREIADITQQSTNTINLLKEDSQKISDVTNVIKDIADQTNLLALNAAIEAARAGEMGRGFAVVADEVRRLAQRTTDAVEEIGGRIKAIQNSVSSVVEGMEHVFEKVNESVALSKQSSDALEDISAKIQNLRTVAEEIDNANRESLATTEDVSVHMQKVIDSAQMISQYASDMGRTAVLVQGERHSLNDNLKAFKFIGEKIDTRNPNEYKNCWEFQGCNKTGCPVRQENQGYGFLGGDAAGRACVFVEGKQCNDLDCLSCPWHRHLKEQHGEQMSFPEYRKWMRDKNTATVDFF